ncbi:anti-sigma factor, partial [Oscillochloris sp. ZM17-4]|uniref:anti-sigma factor n=1 Tax=Oscillochloris sp. ZM17-4 TaxID=2866714 RepID=UPI001C731215
ARAQEARQAGRQRGAARPAADLPPIYRSLFSLPLGQRLAVGLHLIQGYDVARLARITAAEEPSARADLIAAMRAVAPAAGISLTDRTSGDHCLAVRDALVDPAGRLRHAPAIRGHLAGCSHCRAFDLAWGDLSQAVETALRAALRDRSLPAPLEARLLAMARPARRLGPRLRFVLPPLAVLLIVAALVLPGITRQPVTIVNREDAAPADPQALISRALDIHARPPDGPSPIWHARYQTFWYFDNTTVAPLRADIWLDRSNPARHRLQIAHADGGAPYELQLGNGTDRLYYALDALYARSLYGSLPVSATQDQPALISEIAEAPAQSRALADRITYGVWDIPPFYLRQAQAAEDLRVLGRQRDGDRTVQILSFSGVSPMGRPADAPGATAERVTVLLALDLADGRLRSATELAGPAGGTQTSRVTWRLIVEESFGGAAAAGSPFDIGQAWNGIGEFPDARLYRSADPAVPLISAASLGDPAQLLAAQQPAIWLPATPPAGVDRALLIWPSSVARGQSAPQTLVYLGPDRRLILRFNTASRIDTAEDLTLDLWLARLEPGRARSYRAILQRLAPAGSLDPGDLSARMLIDAYGFSRAELVAVIESLRPLDAETLAAQGALFVLAAAEGQ